MVARGAGAAGPVLLADRQWDPPGLARRLPSLGVGALRSAPLLPWRVQCPVRVCAALTAGLGGSGRYVVLCLSRFPLPAPRVWRCVWCAVLSGCPLPSLAGTPFHAVCAFRELGPLALLVVPACPLRVCALALPRRPPPPPWVVWHAHLAQSRHWALVAPFHVVRAPLRVLPRSLAPFGVLGGGRAGPGSPLPGLGLCAPHGAGPWRSCSRGQGLGGGGGSPCAVPPVCATRGTRRAGGRSASFRPPALPGQATKRASLALFWSWGARSPYHSSSCSPALSGRDLCGVLARWRGLACSPRFLWAPAAGAGGQAVLRLLSRAGGGGTIPPALGGWGPAPLRLAGQWGAWGGGLRRSLPAPPLGGRPRFPTLAPLRRNPPRRARSVGVTGPLRGGGDEGRPVDRSPGGPFRPEPPLCPPRVGNGYGGGNGGRGLHTVLVRRCAPPPGLVRAPLRHAGVGSPVGRDPRGSRRLGALGRAVCRSRCIPPPPRVAVPSGGGGAAPRLRGGGGSLLWPSNWGGGARGGGWGGRSAAPRPPVPLGVGLPSVVFGVPPQGILVPWGLPGGRGRRARPGRPPMGRCGGGGGGGGENPTALVRSPPSPGWPLKGPLCLRCPGRRRCAVGRQQAGWERAGGSGGGACRGRGAPSPRLQQSLRGGCGVAVSLVCLRSLLGLRGRGLGGWGGSLVPWRRPLTAKGGRPGGPGTGGQPLAGGLHSSPAPLCPEPDPRAGPRCGPLSPPPSPRSAGRPGAAVTVSGQRLAGCGAVGSPPRSLSPPFLPWEVARAPLSRRIVGVGVGREAQLPPPLSRVRGLGRHLRRRLCGGWGWGGGRLRRR